MRVFVGCLAIALALFPGISGAKLLPSVTAGFESASETVEVGATIEVILKLTAASDAPDVTVEILTPPEAQVVAGPAQWSGALIAGGDIVIALGVRLLGAGEYTLGARVTNRTAAGTEISGAALHVLTTGSTADVSGQDHFMTTLVRATSAADLAALGVAAPVSGAPRPPGAQSVSGTVRWTDPEGNTHPVRGALVQVFDGPDGGPLIANAATGPAGQFSAAVNAASGQVSVRVYSVDWDGAALGNIVQVSPDGQPGVFYILTGGPVPATGAVILDLTSPQPQRGTPGQPDPTPNTNAIRAFSVFDAMRTYWYQGSALLGHSMPTSHTAFPSAHCGAASCFDAQSVPPRTFIVQGDAYDWDVLGQELTHFLTHVFSQGGRTIDDNPGGPRSFGTAIGQNGRSREAGMRLAWSEGLAMSMSLLLQQAPLSTVSPFPSNLLNLANGKYNDTEDAVITVDPETPSPNDGFGSASSILGLLWDLYDSPQDVAGGASDAIQGVGPQLLWDIVTTILPCDPVKGPWPCTRVDWFWNALGALVGPLHPAILELTKLFAMNAIAPLTTAPADGALAGSGAPPQFQWLRQGDPSPDHRNDTLALVFSRDNFQSHFFVLSPPPGAQSYQPTQADWLQLQQGGSPSDVYRWFVAAWSSTRPFQNGVQNPQIPAPPFPWEFPWGLPWFSNVMSFRLCSVSISPPSQSFAAGGGGSSVTVTAAPGCGWVASVNADAVSWVTLTSGSSGAGNGAVGYSVASNSTGSARTGHLTVAGQTFTITQAAGVSGGGGPGPNLAPYHPAAYGWSDKIVVSKVQGTSVDSSPLFSTDTLYVDWAVANLGTASTTALFWIQIYVDGVLLRSWSFDRNMPAGEFTYFEDFSIGSLSPGTHTIRLVADATGTVAESNEGDNEYTKTITVFGP